MPRMITASTAGAAETSLTDVVITSRSGLGLGLGHAPGQLAEADLVTTAKTGLADMKRVTGISTAISQLQKHVGAGKVWIARSHAELFSLTPGVMAAAQGSGIIPGMAGLTRIEVIVGPTAATVIRAGRARMLT